MSTFWYLPAILFPILSGALTGVFCKTDKAVKIYTAAVTCITSVLVFSLILSGTDGTLELIHFSEKLAFSLMLDGPGRVFAGIAAALWPLTVLYAFEYMEDDPRKASFFSFFTISYGVTLGIAFSEDLFTLYCFYELLTLSTVPLVVHTHTKQANSATRIYFAMSLGGAAFAFISMIYVIVSGGAEPGTLTQVFYLFGFFGFGVKAAVFPLHYWLPRVSCAPTPVTALLHAAAVVNAGVFAIIRLTYDVYGTEVLAGTAAQTVALVFISVTIAAGSVMAVREQHLKRRMAYSTVANLSYMLFGVLLLTQRSLTAALMHMVFHSMMKILAFFCVGSVNHHAGIEYLYDMDGMGKRMPVTMACYLFAALGLIGIPPFAGFVSKWQLLEAGASAGTLPAYLGMGALLLSALLTAFYTLTVLQKAFFPARENAALQGQVREAGIRMLFPMCLLALSVLLAGLSGQSVYDALSRITSGMRFGAWGGMP